jgi:hypothetical protein
VHPGTVWISDAGGASVLDAGVVNLVAGRGMSGGDHDLGPVAYLAPEIARRGEGDAKSDQFGLAAVIYAYLTGQDPAPRTPPLRTARREVPAAISDAVERALSPLPESRFASLEEFRVALYATTKATQRLPWVPVVAAVLVVAAVSAFATGAAQRAWRSANRDPAAQTRVEAMRSRAAAAFAQWESVAPPGCADPQAMDAADAAMDAAEAAADDARDAAALIGYEKAAGAIEALIAQARRVDEARRGLDAGLAAAGASPAKDAVLAARDAGDAARAKGDFGAAEAEYGRAARLLDEASSRRAEAEVAALEDLARAAETDLSAAARLAEAADRVIASIDETVAKLRRVGGASTEAAVAAELGRRETAAAAAARHAGITPRAAAVRNAITEGRAALTAGRLGDARTILAAAAEASAAIAKDAAAIR